MRNKGEFPSDLDYSKLGVEYVTCYLEKINPDCYVINVEEAEYWMEQGVDLLFCCDYNSYIERDIEVKFDSHYLTGNIFVETVSNITYNTEGYIYTTQADTIYYLFENFDLYIIPRKILLDWFEKNKDQFKEVCPPTKVNGKVLYKSKGKLVPINKILNELKDVDKVNINRFVS